MHPDPTEVLEQLASTLENSIAAAIDPSGREMRILQRCVFAARQIAGSWDQVVPMLVRQNGEMRLVLQDLANPAAWTASALALRTVDQFHTRVRDLPAPCEGSEGFEVVNGEHRTLRDLLVAAVELIDGPNNTDMLADPRLKAELHRSLRRWLEEEAALTGRSLTDRNEWE